MINHTKEIVAKDSKIVLLVEDEEPHALLIKRALEDCLGSYVVSAVRTLREARSFLEQHKPMLVITDYRLPDGVGTELLQGGSTHSPAYPIVIMTGQGDEEIAVAAMRAGALDYIVKSEANMADMARIAERSLREWHHIKERFKAEQALALSEERYSLAAKAANDGLWDWDLETNKVYYSHRLKAMLGYSDIDFDNSLDAAFELLHESDIALVRAAIDSHLEGGTPHLECECQMRHRSGDYRWMLMRGLAVRRKSGVAYRMAGSLTDITERKKAEQQLQHDALHDVLTNLPNRALFMDRLGLCLERARRHDGYLFAVLFLDLDRFKVVNDSLGHAIGDQLLQAIARLLQRGLRTGDSVCRFGGDEFALVLDGIDREGEAISTAKRISEDVARTYHLGGHEVFITASIGIALTNGELSCAEDLIRDADTAMFRAKALGRGRVELFKRTMRMDVLQQLHLENDLRGALHRNELVVHYQPMVSLQSGKIEGFEALVRWRHPEKGLIAPANFIPLAEETGLINAMGSFVLERACTDLSDWQQRASLPTLSVSVNLSAKQFVEADLVEQITAVLSRTKLNPGCLKLEITENLVMENAEIASALIDSLKKKGIALAMDDFGTGYSSLSYLHRFPVDTLKIDRSFVRQMDSGGNGLEIVRTIIALARVLHMNVTAEGVENANQLQLLRALQCATAQGFHFSKPIDAKKVQALLTRNPRW